jgi:isoaspartyl peptidase/L-asparaginase-like protein (Ntn-hydrolase superfamily)
MFILQLTADHTQYHRLSPDEHDTIGMIALDSKGDMAAGMSTNGLNFKIPGRVSDSALVGSGAYVDNEAGGACATGNGDIMQRFVPSYHVVQLMRQGSAPDYACTDAVRRIAKYYPHFNGAVLALAKDGRHGAACYGYDYFPYTIMQQDLIEPKVIQIPCLKLSRGQKQVPFSIVSFFLPFVLLYRPV